jgi:hypothetical protein
MGSGEGVTIRNFIDYIPPNVGRVIKSRRLRWADHLVIMEEGRGAVKPPTGKPIAKRILGRLKCRWEYNISIDLNEKM